MSIKEYKKKALSFILQQEVELMDALDDLKKAVLTSCTASIAAIGFGASSYEYIDLLIYRVTTPPEVIVGSFLAPILALTIIAWILERVLKVMTAKIDNN